MLYFKEKVEGATTSGYPFYVLLETTNGSFCALSRCTVTP